MEVKFKTKHIIMLSKIVTKMGLTLELQGKSQEEVGAALFMDIFRGVHKAEPELYELLSDLTGYTPAAVAEMEVKELIESIKAVVTELVNFIKPPVA